MAEHTKGFILRQLGHLDNQDPPFSVLPSRRVWLYRDKHAANNQCFHYIRIITQLVFLSMRS